MSCETKLLPCPFCGGEGIVTGDDDSCYSVACNKCDCEVGSEATEAEVAEWWNRRAPAPLVWTHTPPRVVGLYAIRQLGGTRIPGEAEQADISYEWLYQADIDGERRVKRHGNMQFAGPFPEPKEA